MDRKNRASIQQFLHVDVNGCSIALQMQFLSLELKQKKILFNNKVVTRDLTFSL